MNRRETPILYGVATARHLVGLSQLIEWEKMKRLATLLLTCMLWAVTGLAFENRPSTIGAAISIYDNYSPDIQPRIQIFCARSGDSHHAQVRIGSSLRPAFPRNRNTFPSSDTIPVYISVSTEESPNTGIFSNEFTLTGRLYHSSGSVTLNSGNFFHSLTSFQDPKTLKIRLGSSSISSSFVNEQRFNINNLKKQLCIFSYICKDSYLISLQDNLCTSRPEQLVQPGSAIDLANKLFGFIQNYIQNYQNQ